LDYPLLDPHGDLHDIAVYRAFDHRLAGRVLKASYIAGCGVVGTDLLAVQRHPRETIELSLLTELSYARWG